MTKISKNCDLLPLINLFGEEEEAFYQLGLKDGESAKYSIQMIRSLISTPWAPVNKLIHQSFSKIIDQVLYKNNEFDKLLGAYAQGANVLKTDIFGALLIPEFCSFLGSWTKYISPINFGCSSLFTLNEKGEPVHARILDFPLKNTYDKHERIVTTNFKNRLKTFNYSSVGLPFSGLTSMNSSGLTVAIHQKFSNTFNQHGTPIFFLAHQVVSNCSSVKEALELLERSQTITCWNLNIMDKEGNILEIDIDGNERHYNLYNIHDKKFLYICNELVNTDANQEDFLPFGMSNYNSVRRKNCKKLEKKTFNKKDAEILKSFTTPTEKSLSSLSSITPSTMAAVIFNPSAMTTSYIAGEAPKVYTGNIVNLSDLWDRQRTDLLSKKETNQRAKDLYLHLIKAQFSFDTNDEVNGYHELQMALEFTEGQEEHDLVTFFFIVAQYIHEPGQFALSQLMEENLEIHSRLTPYFKDMSAILDLRLSKLTNSKQLISHIPTNEQLRLRFEKELIMSKLNHIPLRHLTFLHLDILDVIFV
ncbi:carcinine hydrolase/isopenicillin-N N-acyltransferase family protein [Bacteriovorax sp. Seq25_V]|uniref:carcinine hydrolase/isopenicillin-N N-acyltransferase family protein n=1 Tax=Bacteriovorax sp. Seq25_V TaxID=1201288 RepID=UPI000389E383|nr:carcinine hydrolase/isopenicillin-N N-acyltransferase family protein [Bacteriovorax sp. Seq25_V]EQC46322.1 acyl-coenzyme A:6-aminopenicillanic acid acyl-transferase [Bacteriovorax sp. Seq25_V]